MDVLEKMIQEVRSQDMTLDMTLPGLHGQSTQKARRKRGKSSKKDINTCPVCHDTGWEQYEQDGYTYCRECGCGLRQRQILGSRLSFANIPEGFRDMRLAGFDTGIYTDAESRDTAEMAVEAVSWWLDSFDAMQERGMGLYLYSEARGSGKTRMAAAIANELVHGNGVQVKFSTSLQILNEIREAWDNRDSGYSEGRLLGFLVAAQVLVIDDFGVENPEKDWIKEKFYHIVNSRYIDRKITIFTSNSRPDLLKYDDRITNRIKERTFQIPFPEESVRDIIENQNTDELIREIKARRRV